MSLLTSLRASAPFAASLLLLSLPADAQLVRVPQGEVGRWSGPGTEMCAMDGRTWKALDATCWYPVDFERRPGNVEIARWVNGGAIEKARLIIEKREYPVQTIDFPDDTFVHLSPENTARLYQEQALIKPLFRRNGGAARFSLPIGKPAEPLPEGKYFGVPRIFNGEPKGAHTGTDYAIGTGNPVLSIADGTVVLIGDHFFAGNSVYVAHGDSLVSMYFHLGEIKVTQGQEIRKGDTVGLVGSTGRSTGPHLHLGVRWRGARIDPAVLIEGVDQAPQVAAPATGG